MILNCYENCVLVLIFLFILKKNFCRSCWAFSAISALDGQLAKKLGKFSSLSEQHLVDCNLKSKGCDGGDPMTAFDYILGTSTKGLNTNAVYPVSELVFFSVFC